MILSDGTLMDHLRRSRHYPESDNWIRIDPRPRDQAVQPASIDLTLSNEFANLNGDRQNFPDYDLMPGEFLLGSTIERVGIPADLVGRVEGKSSLARMGILVHVTAGFCDPGFEGRITLEFSNLSHIPFRLTAGMDICQISFEQLDTEALRPYGHPSLNSNYQGQEGTRESKYARR